MFFIGNKIEVACICNNHTQRWLFMKILEIAFLNIIKILKRDFLFVPASSLDDVFFKLFGRQVKIENYIGSGQVAVDDLKKVFIQSVLIVLQCFPGKNQ